VTTKIVRLIELGLKWMDENPGDPNAKRIIVQITKLMQCLANRASPIITSSKEDSDKTYGTFLGAENRQMLSNFVEQLVVGDKPTKALIAEMKTVFLTTGSF